MHFLRRSLTGVCLLALTLGGLVWAAQAVWVAVGDMLADERPARPAREIVTAVNLVPVAAGSAIPVLETFGEIRSRRTLELRAAAQGRVLDLSPDFEDGGQVAAGALLLRIDPAEAAAALAVARADLDEAEADLADARAHADLAADDLAVAGEQADLRAQALSRQNDLQDRGVGSPAAVETAALAAAQARQAVVSRRQAQAQAATRIAAAETTLARARIALTEATRVLDETELRAGFDGVLSDVTVVEGGLVSRNEALAQLVDPGALEVAFRLSTAQYARLLDGMGRLIDAPVGVVIDAGGHQLTATGRIERESATVGTGQTGRLVFARLDGAVGFRPGDVVTVRISEPALANVARLPARALGAGDMVLVPDAEMRLAEVAVLLLRRQGDEVLVQAPDLEGRVVVAERTPLLGAGLKVRALRPGPDPQAAAAPAEEEMLVLGPERRALLIGHVEGSAVFSDQARIRMLSILAQDPVPAALVRQLEARMGI
ncbi:MAG: efflux RND transporter periplasmic adaptor subunit [Qingshengfaniella sp.]